MSFIIALFSTKKAKSTICVSTMKKSINRMENNTHTFEIDYPVNGFSCRRSCGKCKLPTKWKQSRIILAAFLLIGWMTIEWSGVIFKLSTESFHDFISHFTNFTWTLGAIYYTLDFISLLLPYRSFELIVLQYFWWPVFTSIQIVLLFVFIMVYDNPKNITDLFEDNGGDYYAGLVLIGDKIFHEWPFIIALLYYFLIRMYDIRETYYHTFVDLEFSSVLNENDEIVRVVVEKAATYKSWLYICIIFVLNIMPFFTYYLNFDFHDVYEVETPVIVGILGVLGCNFASIAFIMFLLPSFSSLDNSTELTWTSTYSKPSAQDFIDYDKWNENSAMTKDKAFKKITGVRSNAPSSSKLTNITITS